MHDKQKIKKVIFIVVIVLTVLFIWSNSFRNSDSSMQSSNSIKELVLSFFNNFGINLENSFFIVFIRKIGHFTEYFILGSELAVFKIIYLKKHFLSIVNVVSVGAVAAFFDETIQLIPSLGRSAEIADVWIDIFGVLSAVIIVCFIHFLSKYLTKEKN
ncbi:MAG: VanZ family protein [Acutalibacteraceae bacterium]